SPRGPGLGRYWSTLRSAAQGIAEAGSGLVVFVGHGSVELFAQGLLDAVGLPQRPFHVPQPLHHAVLLHLLLDAVGTEERSKLLQAVADGVHGGFWLLALDGTGGGRLGALEQDKTAVLLVSLGVLLARRMVADEVHEGQRVVGVGHGPIEMAQGQPAETTVVELHELAISFQALLFAEREGPTSSLGAAGPAAQIVEVSGVAVRSGSVGPAVGFHLQDAEIDAQLDDLTSVV